MSVVTLGRTGPGAIQQMSDLTSRFAQTVGQHFVTLSCIQQPLDKPAKTLVFSGFISDVRGEWLYVTAGHILRDIRIAIGAGSTFTAWRFSDEAAGNRFNGLAVPYDFDLESWGVLVDEELGLDYATVHIGGLYRRQLEAGGVKGIGKSAWSNHTEDHDHWALVGTPSESVRYDGETKITARVVVAPLVKASPPELAGNKAQNQFYAAPIDGADEHFKDADGFSGGPVFGLKWVSNKWRYGVIGVQSAWYPTTKTMAICPFSSFGLALEDVVQEVQALVQTNEAKPTGAA
jgi:hypothetical protein